MNITRENIDELNAILKIEIGKEDYELKVEEVLKDHRKKARIDGFRPGKVPAGLIKKLYGTSVLIEEINKLISESLSRYIYDEKLHILGEPLPSEQKQKMIDWDKQTEFEFVFDLGLAPEFDIKLSKKDKFPYFQINIDKKMKDTFTENYTQRFGSFKPVDEAEEKEMLKGSIHQLDETGELVENGIFVEETSLSMEMIKDEKIRNDFKGVTVDDMVRFDIKKAFPNDTEISSILHIDKDEVQKTPPYFRFTIREISRFENAELNQELFDKAFGKDNINSVEEFHKRLEQEIGNSLSRESEYRFLIDTKTSMIEKHQIPLPSDFLKRWLYRANDGKISKEQVEQDFGHFEDDLKWQLIKDKIITDNELKVTEEEALEHAKEVALMQFQQYGMANIPDEHLTNYAKEILKKEEESKKIYERKYEEKVIGYIRESVKVETKKVSSEEFNKLFEK